MARTLKIVGWALAFLVYIWFAGVRNLDAARARKGRRKALDRVG